MSRLSGSRHTSDTFQAVVGGAWYASVAALNEIIALVASVFNTVM